MLLGGLVFASIGVFVGSLIRPTNAVPLSVVLTILISRPTMLGERFPGLSLVGAAVVIVAVVARRRVADEEPRTLPWAPVIFLLIGWLWLVAHRLLNSDSEPYLFTSTLSVLLPVLVIFGVLRKSEQARNLTRRYLVIVLAAVAALGIATYIVGFIFSFRTIYLGPIGLGYRLKDVGFYLPGSFTYEAAFEGGVPRFLGIGREPGMGALFFGWAYFAVPSSMRHPVLVRALLAGGLLATQSTAGIGLFAATWLCWIVITRRSIRWWQRLLGLSAGVLMVQQALFNEAFGLQDKITGYGASFSERNAASVNGLTQLIEQPFTAYTEAPVASVNLVASAAVSGAPWVLLMVLFLFHPMWYSRLRHSLSCGMAFVGTTLLFAQPLAGSTGVFVLVLLSYAVSDQASEGRRLNKQVSAGRTGMTRDGTVVP